MPVKPATTTAEPAFEGHRVELESYGGPAVASLAPDAYPPNLGAAGPSMRSETILLRLPMVMRKTGLARLTIYKLASSNRSGAKRLHWPHEATDRVNQPLGQVAAKELQCQRLREALRWYGDEARAVSRNQAGVLASLTVLSLDGSDTALILAGELVADGAPQP